MANQARKLFSFNNACGTYLSRLAHLEPERVKKSRSAVQRSYEIEPPR
jgi:hypothetical protein